MPDVITPETAVPANAGKSIGVSGTVSFAGIISQEDYNYNLTGKLLIQKVEIMRRSSSTARTALLVVKLPIMGADWGMKPAVSPDGSISDLDQEISDFCEQQLFQGQVDFDSFLRQGLTCFDFGFSIFEKILNLTTFNGQNRIGLQALEFRKQTSKYSWQLDDGSFGLKQQTAGGTFNIPREKLVIFTNEQEGQNYDGISLLRFAYKDWDMLDKLTIVNAIALEKMSIGVPIVSARDGETPSPSDVLKAQNVLRNFRGNEEGFMDLPSTMQVEMLDMKAGTTKEIIPTLQYHDSRIAKSVLAGFMEIGGHSGSGSQALSKDLTAFFAQAEGASAKMLASAMQNDIIKQLVDLNYSNIPNGYPKITVGGIADDNLTDLGAQLMNLASQKLLTPDIQLEADLREKWKLPAMDDDAREQYEKAQAATVAGLELAAEPKPAPVLVAPPTADPKNPSLTKPPLTKEEQVKASVEDLRDRRRKVIEVMFEG